MWFLYDVVYFTNTDPVGIMEGLDFLISDFYRCVWLPNSLSIYIQWVYLSVCLSVALHYGYYTVTLNEDLRVPKIELKTHK